MPYIGYYNVSGTELLRNRQKKFMHLNWFTFLLAKALKTDFFPPQQFKQKSLSFSVFGLFISREKRQIQ